MSTIRQNITPDLPITITLVNLPDTTSATSGPIDNTVDLYISADIQIKFMTTTVSGTGTLDVYLARAVDGGIIYDTVGTLLGSIPAPTATTSYVGSVSVDSLPNLWEIIVVNNTGGPLDSTVGNFNVIFEGKKLDIV